MSAGDLGKRLLGEIEEERLDELLATLRVLHTTTSPYHFGIRPIDVILTLQSSGIPHSHHRSTQHHDNAGSTVISTTRHDTTSTQPPIIEISSPGPNAGKSQFLYLLTAVSILPSHTSAGLPLNGQAATVVVLDTETRFHVPRLAQVLRHHIRSCYSRAQDPPPDDSVSGAAAIAAPMFSMPTAEEIETLVTEALTHVHIFRPQSLGTLIATVESIPEYLFDSGAHFSRQRRVGAVIVDTVSSFIWQDRAEVALAGLPGGGEATAAAGDDETATGKATGRTKRGSTYVALAAALTSLGRQLQAPLLYTTWDLSTASSARSTTSHPSTTSNTATNISAQPAVPLLQPPPPDTAPSSSSLPHPWPTLPTIRIRLSRREVRKFPPGISAREVAGIPVPTPVGGRADGVGVGIAGASGTGTGLGTGLGAKRASAVARGMFDGEVIGSRMRGGPEHREEREGFEMRIHGEGVDIS